jgi:hypothetical protein
MGQVSSSQAREFDDEFPQHTAGHLPIDGIGVEHHGDGRYTSPDSLTDRYLAEQVLYDSKKVLIVMLCKE